MGIAAVSCISGCKCSSFQFDGHTPNSHDSTPEIKGFHVTPHEQCLLEVLILDQTHSGEHKVKLLQVSVLSWVDVSKKLKPLIGLRARGGHS